MENDGRNEVAVGGENGLDQGSVLPIDVIQVHYVYFVTVIEATQGNVHDEGVSIALIGALHAFDDALVSTLTQGEETVSPYHREEAILLGDRAMRIAPIQGVDPSPETNVEVAGSVLG